MDVESLEYADAGVAVFGALADPTRRRLLELLVELRRASATRLAARLPVSRQAVIKHLHVLDTAGLVDGARAGREVLYSARVGALEASARWLADLATSWAGERGTRSSDEQIVIPGHVTAIPTDRRDGIHPSETIRYSAISGGQSGKTASSESSSPPDSVDRSRSTTAEGGHDPCSRRSDG